MKDRQRQCPKCSGEMEGGFILDHTNNASARVETWVEGEPTKSFWTGLKIKDRHQHSVTTYRCDSCGYLESYAPDVAQSGMHKP
jgi:predicted nucleic-acid-binding Zn-ribbon protein